MTKVAVQFTLNEQEQNEFVEADRPCRQVLRGKLGLYSTKAGCHQGTCGACTVIIDGVDIPENRKDDFRREIDELHRLGLAVDGKKFEWHTNDRLRRALELKLFEHQEDAIKLQTLFYFSCHRQGDAGED